MATARRSAYCVIAQRFSIQASATDMSGSAKTHAPGIARVRVRVSVSIFDLARLVCSAATEKRAGSGWTEILSSRVVKFRPSQTEEIW